VLNSEHLNIKTWYISGLKWPIENRIHIDTGSTEFIPTLEGVRFETGSISDPSRLIMWFRLA